MIVGQNLHDLVRTKPGRKRGKITKIAEDDDHFRTLTGEHALVSCLLQELGHLRREESFQSCDPFGPFLGFREFTRHPIEPIRKAFKLEQYFKDIQTGD